MSILIVIISPGKIILKQASCDARKTHSDAIEQSSSQAGVDASTMLTIVARA
jgi:hypothetical protein